MTQQKTRIPEFKNRQEMAEWWDTHSVSDYLDELKPVNLKFELEKSKQETIVVRFNEGVKKYLEETARSKGLNVSSLVRMWTMEHMQEQVKAA
jgi:D-serine dehydratase